MESSNNLLRTEECSSSESGWTMYINSPMQEDDAECTDDDDDDDEDDDDDNNHHNTDDKKGDSDDDDEDSDDSMASDASSGPNHYQQKPKNGEGDRFGKDKGDNGNVGSSSIKPDKREKKGENSSKKGRRFEGHEKYRK